MKIKSNPTVNSPADPGHDWIFAAYLDYLKSGQVKNLNGNPLTIKKG